MNPRLFYWITAWTNGNVSSSKHSFAIIHNSKFWSEVALRNIQNSEYFKYPLCGTVQARTATDTAAACLCSLDCWSNQHRSINLQLSRCMCVTICKLDHSSALSRWSGPEPIQNNNLKPIIKAIVCLKQDASNIRVEVVPTTSNWLGPRNLIFLGPLSHN